MALSDKQVAYINRTLEGVFLNLPNKENELRAAISKITGLFSLKALSETDDYYFLWQSIVNPQLAFHDLIIQMEEGPTLGEVRAQVIEFIDQKIAQAAAAFAEFKNAAHLTEYGWNKAALLTDTQTEAAQRKFEYVKMPEDGSNVLSLEDLILASITKGNVYQATFPENIWNIIINLQVQYDPREKNYQQNQKYKQVILERPVETEHAQAIDRMRPTIAIQAEYLACKYILTRLKKDGVAIKEGPLDLSPRTKKLLTHSYFLNALRNKLISWEAFTRLGEAEDKIVQQRKEWQDLCEEKSVAAIPIQEETDDQMALRLQMELYAGVDSSQAVEEPSEEPLEAKLLLTKHEVEKELKTLLDDDSDISADELEPIQLQEERAVLLRTHQKKIQLEAALAEVQQQREQAEKMCHPTIIKLQENKKCDLIAAAALTAPEFKVVSDDRYCQGIITGKYQLQQFKNISNQAALNLLTPPVHRLLNAGVINVQQACAITEDVRRLLVMPERVVLLEQGIINILEIKSFNEIQIYTFFYYQQNILAKKISSENMAVLVSTAENFSLMFFRLLLGKPIDNHLHDINDIKAKMQEFLRESNLEANRLQAMILHRLLDLIAERILSANLDALLPMNARKIVNEIALYKKIKFATIDSAEYLQKSQHCLANIIRYAEQELATQARFGKSKIRPLLIAWPMRLYQPAEEKNDLASIKKFVENISHFVNLMPRQLALLNKGSSQSRKRKMA